MKTTARPRAAPSVSGLFSTINPWLPCYNYYLLCSIVVVVVVVAVVVVVVNIIIVIIITIIFLLSFLFFFFFFFYVKNMRLNTAPADTLANYYK